MKQWCADHGSGVVVVRTRVITLIALCLMVTGCAGTPLRPPKLASLAASSTASAPRINLPDGTAQAHELATAAQTQVGRTVTYDPSYTQLDYPGGDVPIERGVCTDVVIRAFRALGTDLQVEVHKDMVADFGAYPDKWGLRVPDSNIDHRRVPNLEVYFTRRGYDMPLSEDARDYLPGDIVTWDVSGRPHIGIVSIETSADGSRRSIVHNIGAGAQVEDVLFAYPIKGHFRPY